MESKNLNKLANVGTSQEGRTFPALNFDYVKIDERSFEDLLVFASGYSKLVNFYNLKNKIDGNWSEFLNDETVILSYIIDSDPSGIEIEFKKNLNKATLFKRSEKKIVYLTKCFDIIYDLANQFQYWYHKLKAVESFTGSDLAIKNELASAISSKLNASLKLFINQYSLFTNHISISEENSIYDFSKFDAIWGIKNVVTEGDEVETEHDFTSASQEVLDSISECFQSFYETLLYLKMKAPEYLNDSLNSDKHYPEVALFLSFLKLFKNAQSNINNLSKRHLDFYFSEVLQQKVKDAVRDKVYLKFNNYPNAVVSKVLKNTSFTAGEDAEGNEIVYNSDYDLLVNNARLEKLRTVYISKSTLNIDGEAKELFKEILANDIPIADLTRIPDSTVPKKTFASFGESQDGKGGYEKTMEDASIGFAIASPVLVMKEGYREITLNIQFSEDSFKSILEKLKDLAYIDKSEESDVFVKGFLEAFIIHITTSDGWFAIKNYVVSRDVENRILSISFDLDEADPAIVPFDAQLHSGIYKLKSPIITLRLNNESYIYPYTLLKDLVMDEVEIKVNARGLRDLQIYNNMGQLSADNPFYPFGPMPNVGSYLLVGNNEVFRKSLEDLKINIEWFDLPRTQSGFYGHYDDYNVKIDNSSFEVKLSVLDAGRWKPAAKEQQAFKLFRSEGEPEKDIVNPKSALDEQTQIRTIDTGKIYQAADFPGMGQNLLYTSTAQRGFIKLELSGPDVAFAHTVYPAVVSEIAIKNSRSSILQIGEKKMDKMPNPPYSPQMKSISLDYSSSSVITLKDRSNRNENSDYKGTVFHIHPFGEELVYPDNSTQFTFLLPNYTFEGTLMLGFADLNPPQTVSILFEMYDEYTESSEEELPILEWSYLANNKWHRIKPSKIVRDDTNGFIKTGIVEIEIPYEINRNNTILDSSLFWIRACVIKNIDVASKIVSVYTQVVTATLSDNYDGNGSHLSKKLEPFSIQRSIENIEGIESVIQPLESFNIRPKETNYRFYTRVAEHLRHKSRSITSWDYERIILEKFSDVYKVACLPTMNSKNLDAPGSVLIVVCPYANTSVQVTEPMASSELLYKIKDYITGFVSPFTKIEVRNPNYERIKIICAVKFTDGYNYGYFLQKLNEELRRYLGRSSDGSQANFHLGGKVNVSDILSFMRTLPYVDFITKFSMVQAARDFSGQWVLIDTAKENDNKSFLQATKPWSVLVPALEHQIFVLNEKMEERSLQAGIDSLELGHDFIIE